MPIYEFVCEKCRKKHTRLFRIDEDQKYIICNICGNIAYKIISPTNFVLKGKGWAKDKYNKEE